MLQDREADKQPVISRAAPSEIQAYSALLQQSGGSFKSREQLQAFIEAVQVGAGQADAPGLRYHLPLGFCMPRVPWYRSIVAAGSWRSCSAEPVPPVERPVVRVRCLQAFKLSKWEVVQLINHRPTSFVEIYLVRAVGGQKESTGGASAASAVPSFLAPAHIDPAAR